MPNFNGMNVSGPAYMKLMEAKAAVGGVATIPPRFNIVAVGAQAPLRAFYAATGGKRTGPGGYNPSNDELRDLYNGKWPNGGAGLYAERMSGQPETPPASVDEPEAPKPGKQPAESVPLMQDDDDAAKLAKLLASAMGGPKINPEAVRAMAMEAVNGRVAEIMSSLSSVVAEEVAKSVRSVEVKINELPPLKIGTVHKDFDKVLQFVAQGRSIMLVGPAGCGKTRLAEDVATALGKDYYFSGKAACETKLIGYKDGYGTFQRTQFVDAYEHGGVFLFDEIDGWAPDALIAVNAPLAGRWGDFPCGKVQRHDDFVAIAAANTFGRGADREYVGREQLDAATLDRFGVVEIDYDEQLEIAITSNRGWTEYVQKVRKAVRKVKLRHVVSTRAAIDGGVMLDAGMERKQVEESYLWKGLDENSRNLVLAEIR